MSEFKRLDCGCMIEMTDTGRFIATKADGCTVHTEQGELVPVVKDRRSSSGAKDAGPAPPPPSAPAIAPKPEDGQIQINVAMRVVLLPYLEKTTGQPAQFAIPFSQMKGITAQIIQYEATHEEQEMAAVVDAKQDGILDLAARKLKAGTKKGWKPGEPM